MGLSGNLSTMSLAEILQWLSIGAKTGTLMVDGHGIKKEVYFHGGKISSASSSDPRELIGQFLISSNKLTERQLQVALDMQSRDNVMLGNILLQQNILSKDELADVLRFVSEEIIYDLFLWEEGKFEFFDNHMPTREIIPFEMDVTHIILEGVRRADEWKRIRDAFPTGETRLRLQVDKMIESLPLHPNEERLLRLVDGIRSLDQITSEIRASRFDVCKGLLDLLEAGMIEVGDYQEFTFKTQTKPKEDPLKSLMETTSILIKGGKLDEAERTLERLSRSSPNATQVQELKEQFLEKKLETTAKEMVKLNAVPVLSMSVDAITRLPLSPEEGFVVSRVNGIWDVQSIMKIAPFDENVSLKIFKKFLDEGVIKLK
ncbi:MAG: DUF4388 domain-containing protein [Acidobacteria bacterium]|nr:DUF4388 domain-containing protein [Acidobacteriota bacterium]